jgi:hypothetical protein
MYVRMYADFKNNKFLKSITRKRAANEKSRCALAEEL